MLNLFRGVFSNRYCCGWFSALFMMAIVSLFGLYKWWQCMPIIMVIYIGFRYLAFRYLDE